MRIGIDAIHISRNLKGVGRVERNIVHTLAEATQPHEFVVFLDRDSSELGLPQSDSVLYSVNKTKSLIEWEQVRLNRAARKHQIDCLLTLSDRIPLMFSGPVVMYLFETPDRRRELSLDNKGTGFYQKISDNLTRLVFPTSIERARLIAVPSKFTANELQAKYGVLDRKIMVVPAAVSSKFCPQPNPEHRQQVQKHYGAAEGYILHFSSGDPRENTEVALRAFFLAQIHEKIKMILVGDGHTDNKSLQRKIDNMGLNDRVISVGYVSDSDLVDLYQTADIYIDPSLYEGFGLQVLEAMSCGVPVLCSNTTSLAEIVGDAAITCKPTDAEAFAGGIEYLVSNPVQANLMSDAGIRHASNYSWSKTVAQLIDLCEYAIN